MAQSAHDVHILWSPDLTVGNALLDARNRAKFNWLASAADVRASTTPAAIAAPSTTTTFFTHPEPDLIES